MRHVARGLVVLLFGAISLAQTITYSAEKNIWLITTRDNSYAMGLTPDGQLQHLYWGGPLWRIDDLPGAARRRDISSFDPHEMLENEEYPGWGGPRYYEPALKITRADGDRDLVLRYQSQHIANNTLEIVLKDIHDPIEAVLHYRMDPATGILERFSVVENRTKQALRIESA